MESIFSINGVVKNAGPPINSFHLGVGVFETMLLRQGLSAGVAQFSIFEFDKHLARLSKGVAELELTPIDSDRVRCEVRDLAKQFSWAKGDTAKLRLIALRNDFVIWIEAIAPEHFAPAENGIRAISFSGERSLPHIKSCSAMVSYLARQEAAKQGAGEAILIDRDGILREGAWSNFFWVDEKNRVRTPASRILPGVARGAVMEMTGRNVIEADVALTEVLQRAKEAFITQSTRGIVPLIALDHKRLDSAEKDSVTRKLQAQLQELGRARIESL